ncbi:MAG: hypothetical protein ACK5MR_09005 [Cumulibacter sp.]
MSAERAASETESPSAEGDSEREKSVREIILVVLMSITAVLTAWSGFQASKWGGEMSIAFSEASSARVQASTHEGTARDARQFDLTIYSEWVVATQTGEDEFADYIESRFTPAFAVAFDAWVADGMQENSPFERPEYLPDGTAEAQQWTERADQRFADALKNNQRGDNYSILTVLFALVLFLAALAQRTRSRRSGQVLLAVAGLGAIAIVVVMATYPIKI